VTAFMGPQFSCINLFILMTFENNFMHVVDCSGWGEMYMNVFYISLYMSSGRGKQKCDML